MNGLVHRYFLIICIRIFCRTIFHTRSTTRALVLKDVPRLLGHGDLEVTNLTFYTAYFGIGEDFYIGVPADLDQLG